LIAPRLDHPIDHPDEPNVSRVDPFGADQSDAEHQPTDLAVRACLAR
jgi:hypothetical protein